VAGDGGEVSEAAANADGEFTNHATQHAATNTRIAGLSRRAHRKIWKTT
jgi:hypothetical protein